MTAVPLADSAVTLDVSALVGSWRNTNSATRGIPRIDVERIDGGEGSIRVRSWGAPDHDWGFVPAPVFTDVITSKDAMAFSAVYDLGYCDVHMQANIKGGVLVVATFNRFKDDSSRSSYFMREFYYRVHA